MMRPGPRNLITDVAGLRVGNAHDDRVKTGVTVLIADTAFTAAAHVMGGAPGTRETDLLAPDKTVQKADALVLSGGRPLALMPPPVPPTRCARKTAASPSGNRWCQSCPLRSCLT